jgi:hypothetical protein
MNDSQIILPEYVPATRERESTDREKAYLPSMEAMRLGLRNYSIVGGKGDLVVFLTQARLGDANEDTECMVIARRRFPKEHHVYIPLRDLWRMLQPRSIHEVIPNIAQRLYGFVTKNDLFRVCDVLFDFADDLKNAPPPRVMSAQQMMDTAASDGFTLNKPSAGRH